MADMNVTSKLVLAFVLLLLGVVFIGVIATQGLVVTEKDRVVDESISYANKISNGSVNVALPNSTVTYAPTSWKQEDCPLTSVVVTNGTGTVLTLNTDYTIDLDTGNLQVLNTTATNESNNNNITLVDYTYCDDNYMNLGWGRTGINLVSGFFAIALLMIALALFYSVAKETGMM